MISIPIETAGALQIDGLGAVTDGLEQGAEAEVAYATQDAHGRAHDERERVFGEHRVWEPRAM